LTFLLEALVVLVVAFAVTGYTNMLRLKRLDHDPDPRRINVNKCGSIH